MAPLTPLRQPLGRRAALLLAGLIAAVATARAGADPAAIPLPPAPLFPAAGPANPLLRVLLQEGTLLVPQASGGPLRLLDGQGREWLRLAAGERLRIRRDDSDLVVERPDGSDPHRTAPLRLPLQVLTLTPLASTPDPAGAVGLAAASANERRLHAAPSATALAASGREAPPALVQLDRRLYRGDLQLQPQGSGLLAVNLIPLETYLPSVVGSEMPAAWPAAALQAQAVAARTYALGQRRPGAAFDLRATVASQAYIGVEAETESTRAAVAATRPMVLRFGGGLIQAVFHSSSGGSTENSGDIWTRQLPYLISVPDADDPSPWRQWSLRFGPEQLQRAFRETAGAQRIEVLSSSSTGRVRRARVIGPAGSLELSGSELRQRLGLRSTLVRFRFEEPEPPGLNLPAPAGGGISTAAALAAVGRPAAPPVDGNPRALLLPPGPAGSSGLALTAWPGPAVPPPPLAAARQTAAGDDPLAAPLLLLPSLEVIGRGFGHGVGMSQWGAYALAQRGHDYRAILRHYYRGAELAAYLGR
ncbi:MAG: SpoIID/LytB domain-containing protein [Synechococcus sp.]|nr:SpoIID/LytB domain-containing protein [Synechococcus sp.]